jgi:hypothetical protein
MARFKLQIVNTPRELQRALKMVAAMRGISVRDYVISTLQVAINKDFDGAFDGQMLPVLVPRLRKSALRAQARLAQQSHQDRVDDDDELLGM